MVVELRDKLRWIVSAVLVTGIGSLGWNYAVAPISSWLLKQLLNIATFGINSIVDSMYAATAKEPSQLASNVLGIMVVALVSIFSISYVLANMSFVRSYLVGKGFSNARQKTKTFRQIAIAGYFSYFLFGWIIIGQLMMHMYSAGARSHSIQLYEIVAPVLTEQQRLEVRSSLAQVDSRSSYLVHVKFLRKKCEEYGFNCPDFKIY